MRAALLEPSQAKLLLSLRTRLSPIELGVLRVNKYLDWLSSSNVANVLDSNDRDQWTISGIVKASRHSG